MGKEIKEKKKIWGMGMIKLLTVPNHKKTDQINTINYYLNI